MDAPKSDWWRDFVVIAGVFLCWRTALTLITYAGSRLFPLVPNGGLGAIGEGKRFDYWTSWAQWDGGWFLSIARHGYTHLYGDVVFFPLYPLVTRALSYLLFGDIVLAGLLVSNVAFLGFLMVFFTVVKARVGHEIALTSTISVLVFPTAYFAVAIYSEALFLLLVALMFFYIQKDQIVPSSAFAGLAAATRLVGMAAWLPLAIWVLRKWDWKQRMALPILAGAFLAVMPFAFYCAYLQATFEDPLFFLNVNREWLREPSNPLLTILRSIQNTPGSSFQHHLDVGATLLFVGLLIAGFRKIPFDWWLFSIVVVLIPASSGILMSMPRYVLLSIGTFVILGSFLHQRTALKLTVWSASLILQSTLAVMFINGHWTA